MKSPYLLNENMAYTGNSLSMKVLTNNYVNIPTENFSETLEIRHKGRRPKEYIGWTFIPENSEENLVCQFYDHTPEANHEKYELVKIGNDMRLKLHPSSQETKYVKFVGRGDHIDIIKAEAREDRKKKR